MIVLLDKLPVIDTANVCLELAAIEPLRLAPSLELEQAAGVFSGKVCMDSHEVGITAFDSPAPQGVIEKTVSTSNWTGQARATMESHAAHIVLTHGGGGSTMAEKYIALYKLAAVLGGDHLCGVLVEDAWTSAPAPIVREFTGTAMLNACREQPPPILFTGFVKFKTDDGDWFASKGHHMFGVPDLAMHGGQEKPAVVLDLFMNIFLYMKSKGARIAAGHTLQIAEEVFLKFTDLAPDNAWREWLAGKGATLQVNRISKEEINKPK